MISNLLKNWEIFYKAEIKEMLLLHAMIWVNFVDFIPKAESNYYPYSSIIEDLHIKELIM